MQIYIIGTRNIYLIQIFAAGSGPPLPPDYLLQMPPCLFAQADKAC